MRSNFKVKRERRPGLGLSGRVLPATLKALGSIPDAINRSIVLEPDNTQLHDSVALFLGAVVARVGNMLPGLQLLTSALEMLLALSLCVQR